MTVAGKGKQFLLLFWKNWIIQKRKICCTITEICVPIFLSLVLLSLRQLVDVTEYDNATRWPSFHVDRLPMGLRPPANNSMWALGFTPDSEASRAVMAHVAHQLHVNVTGYGYASEGSLTDALLQETADGRNMLAGVVFTSVFPDGDTVPNHVTYKLRLASLSKNCGPIPCGNRRYENDWDTSFHFERFPYLGPRENSSETGGSPHYFEEGFLALQHAVDRAIILEKSSLTPIDLDNITIALKRHPYPSWINDPFILILQAQFPFYIMLTFLFTAPCIVKDIVLEKERKLKETMKLMGLANWLHWSAWFLKYFTFLLIADIFMTFFYCLDLGSGSVVNYTDPLLLFIFLAFYTVAVIMFCFAISVFFSSANTAAAAAGILFFLSYVPYFFFDFQYYYLSLSTKILSSLLPNVAMAFTCVLIALQEANGVGMQWDNFYKPVNINDDLTMLYMLMILLLDSAICMLIVWYVDNIKPGDFGVPKPWYFPFTKWYWCGSDSGLDEEADAEHNLDPTQHEPLPPDAVTGIRVRGLRKVFGGMSKSPKVAVENLNLDMMEGQITALLGHNGAGKTTTMFMLTGFLKPTKGNAMIGGYDIRNNLDKVRANLGLCPQHDVLFDSLTVKEHLQFFGSLKGCKNLKEDVDEMIELLHLKDKKNRQAHTLSGGMKRKLCVGIALIGGSKVIILDEPTSGMDPEARRQTWDILQKARAGRTMLLTTHFMDEADYLGDRIAIMANGQLVCSGTSLFLKKRYGVGYHMNMVKGEGCEVKAVEGLIKQYVPDAGLESNAGAELSFVLPHESSARFEELFNCIDTQKLALGISSWGASITTMEEVFLKVGEYEVATRKEAVENGVSADTANGGQHSSTKEGKVQLEFDAKEAAPISDHVGSPMLKNNANGLQRNSGVQLLGQQFVAMFLKRVINSWRSPVVTVVQLAIPILFTILGCSVKYTIRGVEDPHSLTLSFDNYFEPVGPYKGESYGESAAHVNNIKSRFQSYMRQNGAASSEVTSGENYTGLDDYLIDQANTDKHTYINSHIAAGYFQSMPAPNATGNMLAIGSFNNEAIHAPPIALTAIMNAILRFATESNDVSIETTNHPLPLPASFQAERDLQVSMRLAFVISYDVAFGMSFLIATFVTFLIKERAVKAKHCQFTSGVPVPIFWAATFLWDLLNYLVPCFAILVLFAAFDIEGYVVGENLGACLLLLLLYGMAVLPFVYLISFLFEVAASGYVVVVVINIITGTVASVTVFILKIPALGTADEAEIVEWLSYILLPNFCFINGLQELYNNYNAEQTCIRTKDTVEELLEDLGLTGESATFESYCQTNLNPCCPGIHSELQDGGAHRETCGDEVLCSEFKENPLDWESPGTGRPALFMFLQCIIYFGIIFFLESGLAKKIKQKIISKAASATQSEESVPVVASQAQVSPERAVSAIALEDTDVAKERARIRNTPLEELHRSEALVLNNLVKYYGGFLAVDGLSLGIKQGECFGLLGVNGAGKTTTFKMLTGDETITAGKAYVKGFNVASQIKQVQQQVGYCPQFDALIEKLTVKETLVMYARLRGVQEEQLEDVVLTLIQKLLLSEYTSRRCGNLSGGNKRKLSTAIALVGNPPLVFLDEPTTGMDPVARRQLWNTLVEVRESGRTIILTSHSMEECEALCTRLVVMVNGQFKCVGSSQHLKDKFGEGYALMAKVTPGENQEETQQRTVNLMGFVETQFPGCVLKDSHPGLLLYQISSTSTTLAKVFGLMERNKDQLYIEDYSVSQTTLEQVFINFARAQRPPLDDTVTCGHQCGGCCRLFCCCQ